MSGIIGGLGSKSHLIKTDKHYRSAFADLFPLHNGVGIQTGTQNLWVDFASIQGAYGTYGKSLAESLMPIPPNGFEEAFYITVVGGTGSGSATGQFKVTDSSGSHDGISPTYYADGWYAYGAQFAKTMLVGTFNGTTLRNSLTANTSYLKMWYRNTAASGYAGITRVILEQRIYL
tara:strand:- start:288 stop:812 length:525 start_codon:yes stop_codon:yes gene_type:complete